MCMFGERGLINLASFYNGKNDLWLEDLSLIVTFIKHLLSDWQFLPSGNTVNNTDSAHKEQETDF